MSRYAIEEIRSGVTYLVSFGYDNPCTEYFLHVEQIDPRPEPTEEDEQPELIFAIASYNTMKCHPDYPGKFRWPNSELLRLFEHWGVPSVARVALAMDLPF